MTEKGGNSRELEGKGWNHIVCRFNWQNFYFTKGVLGLMSNVEIK